MVLVVLAVSSTLCAAGSDLQVERKSFPLDGYTYVATLNHEPVMAGPSWEASSPPPLTFDIVERAARKELRKLMSDEPSWVVFTFELHHMLGAGRGTGKWYYAVEFRPPLVDGKFTHNGLFYVFIDASGNPGTVERKEHLMTFRKANQTLQATPRLAFLFFLAQRPGAPELGCSAK